MRGTVTGQLPTTMTVVGTTIVNDTYETSPGRGGVVSLEWIEANSPESSADPYVVRLAPDADVEAFSADLEERFSAVVSPPVRTRRDPQRRTNRDAPVPVGGPRQRAGRRPRWPMR